MLRPGAIGDTLVTTPALLALRRQFAEASMQVVGNPAALPLLRASQFVDEWLSFDALPVTRLFAGGAPPDDDPFQCDVAVAWCADPDGILRRGFELRGAKQEQIVVAPSRPGPEQKVHVARHLLETLTPLGVQVSETLELPPFTPPPDAIAEAATELAALGLAGRPFVAIHPSSGSASKNWPAEHFAEVMAALEERHGLPPLVLAGPADDDVLTRLVAQARQPLRVLAGRPLAVVAAVLQQARAFLGNDSGLAHLAGQLSVPTLALFGPMDPAVWSPLGPHVRTLRHQPLAELPVETVLSALPLV
ncbi:MAG: glycosyltransferase family 9 protein [Chloroflexota bacterium]